MALTIELTFGALPVLDEALRPAAAGVFPGGAKKNLRAYTDRIRAASSLADWQRLLLADPQTSGGLLIAFPAENVEVALADLVAEDCDAAVVGRFTDYKQSAVVVCKSRVAEETS